MYVAFLRGINVGGHRKVDMKHLKACFEQAGMNGVRTYINSGNVIFRSESTEATRLVLLLESTIESAFGFPIMLILRDAGQIRALTDAMPESWVDGKDAKCNIMFLSGEIDSEEILAHLTVKPEIDDVRYLPGAVLWRVDRYNVTRSGIMKLVGTELYAKMTVRNCNTVRKVAALMRE